MSHQIENQTGITRGYLPATSQLILQKHPNTFLLHSLLATFIMEDPPYALDPDESRVLEEEQILLSGLINGKRKVSAALLSKSFFLAYHPTFSISLRMFNIPNYWLLWYLGPPSSQGRGFARSRSAAQETAITMVGYDEQKEIGGASMGMVEGDRW